MNDALIANICTVLSTMKADQKWTENHDEAFMVGLEDLPDEAGVLLRREILKQWDWRPSVREVRELWAKISRPPSVAAEEIVGRMLELRREKGPYSRRIPDDPYCRWEFCEPPWSDPIMAKVSFEMGGWTAFCSEQTPLGVIRGQLLRVASAVVGGEGDETLSRLRLEYQAQRAALSPPPPVLDDTLSDAPAAPDAERDGDLVRMGAMGLKGLK